MMAFREMINNENAYLFDAFKQFAEDYFVAHYDSSGNVVDVYFDVYEGTRIGKDEPILKYFNKALKSK